MGVNRVMKKYLINVWSEETYRKVFTASSKEEAESRLKAQLPANLRKVHADIVLKNDKSSDYLIRQTEIVLKRLKSSKIEDVSPK